MLKNCTYISLFISLSFKARFERNYIYRWNANNIQDGLCKRDTLFLVVLTSFNKLTGERSDKFYDKGTIVRIGLTFSRYYAVVSLTRNKRYVSFILA